MLFTERMEYSKRFEKLMADSKVEPSIFNIISLLDACGLLKQKRHELNIIVPIDSDPYDFISREVLKRMDKELDDVIAVLSIDGEMYNTYMQLDCRDSDIHYNFDDDWYEGQTDIRLIDIIPLQYAVDSRMVII